MSQTEATRSGDPGELPDDLLADLARIAGLEVTMRRLEFDRPSHWETVHDELQHELSHVATLADVGPVADSEDMYVGWRRRPLWWLSPAPDHLDPYIPAPLWTTVDPSRGEIGTIDGNLAVLEALAWLDGRVARAEERDAAQLRERAVTIGAPYAIRYRLTHAGDRLLVGPRGPIAALGWDPRAQIAPARRWDSSTLLDGIRDVRRDAHRYVSLVASGLVLDAGPT